MNREDSFTMPTTDLSRRGVLRISLAAAGIAAIGSAMQPPKTAWAADTYDAMRVTWVGNLTGSGFNPAVAPFSTALTKLGQDAAGYRGTMTPGGAALWPDLPLGSISGNVTTSYRRLRTMALAYIQPGTGLTGNASLASTITVALDWMCANAYTPTTTTYNNWWDWQIGAPANMLDTALLMYGELSGTQIANYCAAIDHFVPVSLVSNYSGTSTGANRADLCKVLALRGVLAKNDVFITTAKTALSPIFPHALTGDGLYSDGSFIQHTWIPYTGSYGEVLLNNLSKMSALLAGTPWMISDPQVQNFYNSVTTAYAPFVFNGLIMDGVSGRANSRGLLASGLGHSSDHTRGHSVVSDILRLATTAAVSPEEAAAWKALVKGWLQREYYEPLLSDSTQEVPELARAQALLNDATVTAAPEPVEHRLFGMDRAVHRRPRWAAAISMCSTRTGFYEQGNGENLRGWHSNSGMLYWWGDIYGNGQYSDDFWPTVDPYALPGTTVSAKPLADGAGKTWGMDQPNAPWAGGATDGTYAVVGQDVRGLQSTLAGKKSWFCLDDSIFCLGAGISASDGTGVRTTIDNRNMGSGNAFTFSVDGVAQPSTLGWSNTFNNPGYMTVNGVGAWIFPQGGSVTTQRLARTGKWSDINGGGSTTALTRNYLTMSFEHGTNPSGASYCYQLMPGATPSQAAARAATPNVTVLANTATAQAIHVPSLGLTLANFFGAGTAGPITVDKPCSVLVREQNGTMSVHLSDPTRASATVQATIASTAYPKVTGTPNGITALTTTGKIVLLAEVGGILGSNRSITLSGAGTVVAPATAALVAPTASTYVRDGSYASTNYGGLGTMVVKNPNSIASGYARRSLTTFDLTGITGTVKRAVLWVYGNVQDSGGARASLQAFSLSSAPWQESTVTWNNAPALGSPLGSGTLGTPRDWVALEVTGAVAAASGTVSIAVDGPVGLVGLASVLDTRGGPHPPQLQVITA